MRQEHDGLTMEYMSGPDMWRATWLKNGHFHTERIDGSDGRDSPTLAFRDWSGDPWHAVWNPATRLFDLTGEDRVSHRSQDYLQYWNSGDKWVARRWVVVGPDRREQVGFLHT